VREHGDRARPGGRAAFWGAWSVWALTISTTALSISYGATHAPPASVAEGGGGDNGVGIVFVVVFATVGALLAWKRSANPIGWLLCGTGACNATAGLGLFLADFRVTRGLGLWLGFAWLLSLGISVYVLLVFPTGSLPSSRWRFVAWATGLGLVCWTIGNAFAPVLISSSPATVRNPIGVPAPAGTLFEPLANVGAGLMVLTAAAAVASLAFRYRRAGTVEREQLKWLVFAGVIIGLAIGADFAVSTFVHTPSTANNLQNGIVTSAIALVPIAIAVAIFRYRLYDIDLVISKTLVYGSLAFFITGVYVGIVAGIGSLTQHVSRPSPVLSILATATVAVAFQPVRERVQRVANRLVFGYRATPYEVLTELSGRMTGTIASDELLDQMAKILAAGTGAVRADVWLRSGAEFKNSAVWPPEAERSAPVISAGEGMPVVHGADRVRVVRHAGEVLGALSLRKGPGERLTPTEDQMLNDLAAQAGLVLRNIGLTDQLLGRLDEVRASRKRLVAAQDEERRRIERNIHDGAQQQLVALAIKLSLTQSLIGVDAEGEREMLAELSLDAREAVENLRDLARGIYPPLLAERGLVEALRTQATKAPVPVVINAGGLGRYPPETEAGLYFCILEALQNVVKYASASSVTIALTAASGNLTFGVSDDGVGFDVASKAGGTGLQGISDRLAALGGQIEVRSALGRGTTLTGTIPLAAAELVA
jgi:signal transduction histidine kinase